MDGKGWDERLVKEPRLLINAGAGISVRIGPRKSASAMDERWSGLQSTRTRPRKGEALMDQPTVSVNVWPFTVTIKVPSQEPLP